MSGEYILRRGRPGVLKIYQADECVGTLPAALVRQEGYGFSLSAEALDKLRDAMPSFARRKALDLLAARDYGPGELQRKLMGYGLPEDICAAAVAAAVRSGLVDEAGYAARRARAGYAGGKGTRVVAADLRARGIGDELIREVTDDPEASAAALVKTLAKLRPKYGDSPEGRRKLYAALARRGFTGDDLRGIFSAHEDFDETP